MLGTGFTYKYSAQASGTYGSDAYGSCEYGEACQTTTSPTNPDAPNTGFLATENAPVFIGGFIAIALLVTLLTYAVLRKIKKQKS